MTKPSDAIEKLAPVEGPVIGLYTHWVYGPHTVEGVVGNDNPFLMVSNFSGKWPGLVGLLNTGACLAAEGRNEQPAVDRCGRLERRQRLSGTAGGLVRPRSPRLRRDRHSHGPGRPGAAAKRAAAVFAAMRKRRPIALMLGDTSMGMINGYFGARLLHRLGFAEHKVDQAWLLDYGSGWPTSGSTKRSNSSTPRASPFIRGPAPTTSTRGDARAAARLFGRARPVEEFKADCVGWQYQLGLIKLRPPADFAEGLLNSACRPESNGHAIIIRTEADRAICCRWR